MPPTRTYSCILISASGPFICPMDLGEITDVLAPLPWPHPLEGCISHFNRFNLTLLCLVIFLKNGETILELPHSSSHLPSLVRCSSPRKRNHLQVALAVREDCGLSSWELGIHFLGIHSSHKKFKCTQTLWIVQRVLLPRSVSVLGRCKVIYGPGKWGWVALLP